MGSTRDLNFLARRTAGSTALGGVVACALALVATLAVAQDAAKAPEPAPTGFFATIGRWFNQTTENFHAGISGMRTGFQHFGHEAGLAAKTTVDTAKDAAESVGHLSTARVIAGHEKCRNAPNGAPDCVAAADAICKTKGFKSGKSVDMTTAEVCPAQVYLSGQSSGPGCHTVTFVSRALCQ
jgi:hypothetical protein